ncbi:aspartyl-phosphate phosphatase Spo0E family protein [Salibacterium salarium]|uniref:Aspartyl-phosphate phosphatase Spo0E family protein n=1 Tax=Salibacterium salarium TaxID=284579 RepID=A0A3R9PF11_9BACI|nr:aspartyl-phosphate phosphatase Spo0E family protein [Salibacterium salarium]RSL29294.1 aspartyl-phosphate phosphatase Spo0E family protein [Salibacterium salarium]
MVSEKILLQEIEYKRKLLNEEARKQPLFSEDIVRLSKELDHLLNKYDDHYSASLTHFYVH